MKIKKFNESNDSSEYLKSKCMTVGKLKKLLEKYPNDMLVAVGTGDYDLMSEIATTSDDILYCNGDSPDFIYDLQENEVLYIRGVE